MTTGRSIRIGVLLILTLVLSAVTSVGVAHAQGPDLTADDAMAIVDDMGRLEEDLLEAQPTDAELAYLINDDTGAVEAGYWLVQVGGAEGPVGLVGIDPNTGEFQFETRVPASYQFPHLDRTRVSQDLDAQGINPENYNFGAAKFAFIGGGQIAEGNYWLVPNVSGEVGDTLTFPAFDKASPRIHQTLENVGVLPWFTSETERPYYRLGDGLLQQAQTGLPTEQTQTQTTATRSTSSTVEDRRPEADSSTITTENSFGKLAAPATAGSKVHLKNVPLFHQGDTPGCALYALAMAHQWWSPVDLGIPHSQAYAMTQYQGDPGDFGPNLPKHVKAIMNNWDKVDASFEDFQTTTSKQGSLSDLRFWTDNRRSPVLVLVNSDSKSVGFFDHWVLVTGFNDGKNKLYLNNSGASVGTSAGSKGTVAYGKFTNSYWTGWGAPNYSMVPGDRNVLSVSPLTPQLTGDIADDEQEQVGNLGLSISNDDAQEGTDSFGDGAGRYATRIVVRYLDGEGRFTSIQDGQFDTHSIVPQKRITFTHDSGLFQGDTLGQSSTTEVYLDPGHINPDVSSLGQNRIEIEYFAFDDDDRVHGSSTVTVYNFAPNSACNFSNPQNDVSDCYNRKSMPKPVLQGAYHNTTQSFTVSDDEPAGPSIGDFRPMDNATVEDDHAGSIDLKATVGDPYSNFWDNIAEVRLRYEIYDAAGAVAVGEQTKTIVPDQNMVQPFRFAVPRSDWLQGMAGGSIKWHVEATDTDNDRPGDISTTTSNTLTVKLEDDDALGPAIIDHSATTELFTDTQQKTVRYTLNVTLTDTSGVLDDATYPTIYYRWDNQNVTESTNDGAIDADGDGSRYTATVTAPLDKRNATLYWRVKARDKDADRSASVDRATSWSSVFQAKVPARLCVSPASIDHDFGALSNVAGGTTTAQWPFTVKNCGGSSLTVFGGVEQGLQNRTGSTPQCPHSPGHCWLGVSGIPSSGERLFGGQRQTVTVQINAVGFDYQVPALTPGEYEGEIRFDRSKSGTTLTGTINVDVPKITVTAPQQGAAWENGETYTVTWQSAHMPAGTNVKLELTGPASHVIASSVANTGTYTWTVPTSGIQDGQYRVNVSPVGLPTMAGQSAPVWIGNAPPAQPTNLSPSNGAHGISSTPRLTSSTFTDANTGDTHRASQWQLRSDTFGTSQYSNPLWDSMTDTLNLQSTIVPRGILPARADAETEITVEVGDQFFVPAHFDVTRGQQVTLTVKNVGTITHSLLIPELEESTPAISPGGTATVAFTPHRAGEYTFYCSEPNHRDLGEEGTLEVDESVYWWRVRHQDSDGAWSPWSAETKFSIVYSSPISVPAGLLNFQHVLADFRQFSNLTITYNPLDNINLGSMKSTSLESAAEETVPLQYAGVGFELTARDQNGEKVTQFDEFYTLTVSYEDWQWQNAGIGSEQSVNFYWNTGQGWQPVLPCDGCSRDRKNNQIVARLDHLTEFALLGESTVRVYVPIVVR